MDRLSTKFIAVIGLTDTGQSYIIRTLVSPLDGADRLVSALLNTFIFSLPRIPWCAATQRMVTSFVRTPTSVENLQRRACETLA